MTTNILTTLNQLKREDIQIKGNKYSINELGKDNDYFINIRQIVSRKIATNILATIIQMKPNDILIKVRTKSINVLDVQ